MLGRRDRFPDLEVPHYFNHAAIGPLSAPVVAAMAEAARAQAAHGVGAVPSWLDTRERARRALADLVGAAPEEVALTGNTTDGVRAVALGFPWRRGDRILLFDGEFPANVTPWQRAAGLFGLEVVFVPADLFRDDPEEGLAAVEGHLARGVRLVAVSAVQFQTGLRMPVAGIAERAHAWGAEVFVDGIQAVGAVPIDMAAEGIDYLAAGGHKWLGGPFGTGFLAVRRASWERLRPHLAGWLSHVDGMAFLTDGPGHLRYDRPFVAGPAKIEGGAFNAVGVAGLAAAAEHLVGLGPARIAAHVTGLLDGLEAGLVDLGFESLRSPRPARRSGILSLRPPEGIAATDLVPLLAARGVAVTAPDGLLRFAPHWPNHEDEVAPVLAAVAAALREVRRGGRGG